MRDFDEEAFIRKLTGKKMSGKSYRTGGIICGKLIRILMLLAMAMTPLAAQVQWVSSAAATASTAIPIGVDDRVVCRGQLDGVTYIGAADGINCRVAAGGSARTILNYEVAVGLASWEPAPPPGLTPSIGGAQGVVSIFPCRFQPAEGGRKQEAFDARTKTCAAPTVPAVQWRPRRTSYSMPLIWTQTIAFSRMQAFA